MPVDFEALGRNPAMRVLIECARTPASGKTPDSIRSSLAALPSWDELLGVALRHRLIPMLAARLHDCRDAVPARVHSRLQSLELANAATVLNITAELVAVLRLLRSRGILAVPYKGPVLSQQLYGNFALRSAGDIDLLVRRRDAGAARHALMERGYTAAQRLTNGARAFMLRSRYSEGFLSADRVPLELHWAFTNRDIAFPLELEDLTQGLGTVDVAGEAVPVFCREDLLLILCVHGAKHRWDRLELICGMAAAVRSAPPLDWKRLVDRSTELGVSRMLLLGLLLAHQLMQAPVPRHVVDLARRNPAVVNAASLLPAILLGDDGKSEADSLPTDVFRYRLRERWRDRARFLFHRLTTPSQPERWISVSVGRRVIPLHAFLRPFRLIARAAAVLRNRLMPAR